MVMQVICILTLANVIHSTDLHNQQTLQPLRNDPTSEADSSSVTPRHEETLNPSAENTTKNLNGGVVEILDVAGLERKVRKTWMGLGSVDVGLEWRAVEGSVGYSVRVGSLQWTLRRDHHFYTLPELPTGRAYNTIVSALGANFSYDFYFSAPSIIPDKGLHDMMREKKNCSDGIKIPQVSLLVKLEGVNKKGMVLEVKDISTSRPLQWVDLPIDSRKTYITGLLPDKFLSLTLRQVLSTNPLQLKDILSKTVFTGGCIAPPPYNLTRTLDIFFPSTIVKSRWGVHCYADDEVFFGYPCRNSDDCIPRNWMCDGDNDCPDGDDERDCGLGYQRSPQCRKTEFRCLKRRENVCLPIKWLCDGRHDCSDGWDEEPRNCRSHYSRPGGLHYLGTNCRDSYFRCHNSLGCVAPKFVCDGEDDCADGSDEWNCPSDDDCDSFKEFQCFQSWGKDRCIPRSWMCDDQEDCDRGEDEHFDICRRVL